MLIWEIIWGLLALNQIGDAARNRRRLKALPCLGDGQGTQAAGFRVMAAPGVHVDDQTERAARVHIEACGLAALDLVPAQVTMDTAWSLGCHVDPDASREESWDPGATACHAFLAPEDLLVSMGVAEEIADLGTFVALAGEVKRRVTGRHDLAIAPRLVAMRPNPFFRADVLGVRLGGGIGPVAIGMPLMWLIVGLGVLLAPWAGLVVVGLLLLQGPLSILGTGLKVRGWWWQAPLRIPTDFINWLRLLASREVSTEQDAADRAAYEALLWEGTAVFFEPEATHCPMCGGEDLRVRFTMPDVFQGKPGRFRLRRCRECGHTFQDPRLNPRGLAFYYRDAYDGRNASGMDTLFGSYVQPYEDRIEMVRAHHTSARWLDVGCGHGHLCAKGQFMLPEVQFDGLDMGSGVEIARDRGWLQTAHLGLFPDRAESLAGTYDVVSMSHYLEHTVDPRAEISAAYTVLEPGGVLLIEVPDPDSPWIGFLGRFWMPWFQPQHLHFVSSVQLAALLREAGFQPIAWDTGRAHQGSDLVLSAYTWLRWLSRPLDVPWRKPPTILTRLWSALVWVPGSGLLVLALLMDLVLRPLGRRLHHASAYRVLARRMSGPVS